MNQLRKAKSRNPRRHAVLPRKYIKVVVTYVLLFAIVFSNMSNPLLNVFAGQKKEEFRIHADELQRAAEEALEEGNIVEEPLDFYTKDSSLLKEYEELFAADGTLYEIFPDYEREYYLDDIELRIFLRISPDADPDSYALTGEETLIFLYTNGGEETVAGRVNIDGYISGICSLKSYMTAFEKKENVYRPSSFEKFELRKTSISNTLDLRGYKVEDALDSLEFYLDKASLANLANVTVIHGHGTGALKSAVRDFLSTSPYVAKFRPGEDNEGGDGVSIVDIN